MLRDPRLREEGPEAFRTTFRMTRAQSHTVLAVLGLIMIVAFFLPFLDVGGMLVASGWDIVLNGGAPWSTRLPVLAVPLLGLSMLVTGLARENGARLTGLLFGAGVLGYLTWTLARIFVATTGWGLWVVIVGACASIVVAAAMPRR